ncbi:erkA [Symbiodinium sp. KB8]|nr:erkA [Symbiodinium sp. KB8]
MAAAAARHGSSSEVSFVAYKEPFKLGSSYELVKQLGRGAYGVVASARRKDSGSEVAIKKIKHMCDSASDAKHTLREIRLMRYLGRHENIVSLKDLVVRDRDDELYVIMELMDTDLHRIIQSPQELTDAHAKHFMFQLLRGVHFAHANDVIHRDLKPANLLVNKNCDIRISDFGLSRMTPGDESETQHMTEHVVTRWYRAPELMLSADGHYTKAIDIWSCGCILAEVLGRKPLWPGKDFMHQLVLIFDIIGLPPAEEREYIRSDQALKFLASLPEKVKQSWGEVFPQANPKAIDLLEKMLQFHPTKRLTIEECIAHPYFDSVRDQYDDDMPTLPDTFEFSFEEDKSLTLADFRALIIEEAQGQGGSTRRCRRRRGQD